MAIVSWTQSQAIDLCRQIEAIAPEFGCHVALTGGLLYKDGNRKDCDIVFYRVRQVAEINVKGLFDALCAIGVRRVTEKDCFQRRRAATTSRTLRPTRRSRGTRSPRYSMTPNCWSSNPQGLTGHVAFESRPGTNRRESGINQQRKNET